MSVESNIAAFVEQAAANIGLPQQIAAASAAERATWLASITDLHTKMRPVFFIDPINGVDTAAGTVGAPLRTIKKAVDIAPLGSVIDARITSAITIAADTDLTNKHLVVRSATGVSHQVDFLRSTLAAGGTTYRTASGFNMGGVSGLSFVGLTINFPALAGFEGYSLLSTSSIIRSTDAATSALKSLAFVSCALNFPASMFGQAISGGDPTSLAVVGCTETGSSMLGRLFTTHSNTAGTSTSGIPWLVTALSNI